MVLSAEPSVAVLLVDVCFVGRCLLSLLQAEGEGVLGCVSDGAEKRWCTFIGRRSVESRKPVCVW